MIFPFNLVDYDELHNNETQNDLYIYEGKT